MMVFVHISVESIVLIVRTVSANEYKECVVYRVTASVQSVHC